jgi:hypothetical protein
MVDWQLRHAFKGSLQHQHFQIASVLCDMSTYRLPLFDRCNRMAALNCAAIGLSLRAAMSFGHLPSIWSERRIRATKNAPQNPAGRF